MKFVNNFESMVYFFLNTVLSVFTEWNAQWKERLPAVQQLRWLVYFASQQQQQQPLLEYRRSHDKQRSQHTFEIKTNKLILWSGPKYGNCPFLSTKFWTLATTFYVDHYALMVIFYSQ